MDWDQVKGAINRDSLATGIPSSNCSVTSNTIEENSTYKMQRYGDDLITINLPLTTKYMPTDMTNITVVNRNNPKITLDTIDLQNYKTGSVITRMILNNFSVGLDLTGGGDIPFIIPAMVETVVALEQRL